MNHYQMSKNCVPEKEDMVLNEMMGARGNHRILSANPAFGKFQSAGSHKDSLLLKETEPRRTNYGSQRAKLLNRNYYSAAESNGEEEYETRGSKLNGRSNFMHKSRNDEDEKKVSYATITLRQPLKDSNYFSDTEAFHNAGKLRIRNSSNGSRFESKTASNRSLQQQLLQQGKEKQHPFLRSNSLNNPTNPNANISDNQTQIDNKFRANNLNYNIENHNSTPSSTQVPRSSVSSMRGMFDQAHATNFNRQAHGFSKLSNFYGTQIQPPPQPQFSNGNQHVWSPPPVHPAPIKGMRCFPL
ncbi:hypothetical protein BpHYR1_002646 [Brachionus plicatilis]|uniref:Uncharacterized protein n=1 Tax=Brachionus plicatilis TaxID=10195 RepID=A0A3M7PTV7_BRAPC|nr:hypothetical protein BpHYR1_002646 [Brachionus plicatilis]